MDEDENAMVESAVAAAEEDQDADKKQIDSAKPPKKTKKMDFGEEEDASFASVAQFPLLKPFTPPPLSLLEKDRGKPETGDIKANANISVIRKVIRVSVA